MALEIEHKYLVIDSSYRTMATEVHHICQGYLSTNPERTVRVRILDTAGYLTVKGVTTDDTRHEYEYEIPAADAREMLGMCGDRTLCKKRYIVPYKGRKWEVDEFEGRLEPLVLAEIELPHAGCLYECPPFIGENVTGDPRYYNSCLIGIK